MQKRPSVKLNLELAGKRISTIATLASRSHLNYPIIIGVRDLKGFYINPENFPQSEADLALE